MNPSKKKWIEKNVDQLNPAEWEEIRSLVLKLPEEERQVVQML